jgi:D-lactate dehydrogenase
MRIAFFEVEPWMKEIIERRFSDHVVIYCDDPLTLQNASTYDQADIVSIKELSKTDASIISKFSHLLHVSTRTTGYDHIDLDACSRRGIIVTNVPGYGSVTVAEHTWALILALSRRIFESYDRTEASDFSTTDLRGFDLYDKTLGIIGLGAIGKHVALMSKGFGMKLRVYTPDKDFAFAEQFSNFVFVDRPEDVFTHADVISFHAPLTKQTFHMLNMTNYALLKKGSIIINTSRGGLIETQAIVKALEEKIIRSAGLDVLEAESLMKLTPDINEDFPPENELAEAYLNHRLIGMKNVLITPHNGFNSDESVIRQLEGNLDAIQSFIADGSSCINQVE